MAVDGRRGGACLGTGVAVAGAGGGKTVTGGRGRGLRWRRWTFESFGRKVPCCLETGAAE